LPFVTDARVSTTLQRGRLVVDLSSKTEFAIVSLTEPNRIAVDVRASEVQAQNLQPVAGTGLLGSYSIEMAGPDRARTVLTLNAPAQVQQAYVLDAFADQPARLVVDIIPATPDEFAANAARDLAVSQANQPPAVADASTQPGGSNVESVTRPLVVIDAGHGGRDNGAETPGGIKEKDITLAFAKKVQELLVNSGRFDVALTREDDTYLQLTERVALARANKADLFISIHADSFQQEDVRGASVYTRDENATDVLDRVLADGENKLDLVAGLASPEMADSVVNLLVDLMRREIRRQSYLAAQSLVHQLEPSVALRPFPLRQAAFFVLQAPDVPSVLVELGFLSNTEDRANLLAGDWQTRTADALARGISTYFDALANNLVE
jgi:N-acetylmuramoyl-L-alanine amidase